MAITFVAADKFVGSTSVTNIPIPKPTGATSGDVLVAIVASYSGGQTITQHANWTSLQSGISSPASPAGGQGTKVTMAYRVLGGSEPSSWNWTLSASSDTVVGSVMCFRGVDNASPIRTSGNNIGQASSLASPSLTGVQATDMVVTFGASRPTSSDSGHDVNGQTTSSWTSPAGCDTGASANAFGFPVAAAGSYKINGTTSTFTVSVTGDIATVGVALKAGAAASTNASAGAVSDTVTANKPTFALKAMAPVVGLSAGGGGGEGTPPAAEGKSVVWSDDFSTLDSNRWWNAHSWSFPDSGPTNSFLSDNIYLNASATTATGGQCVMTATWNSTQSKWNCGLISTENTTEFFQLVPGDYWEANFQLPTGNGGWFSMWTWGDDQNGVPQPGVGEVDVLEWHGDDVHIMELTNHVRTANLNYNNTSLQAGDTITMGCLFGTSTNKWYVNDTQVYSDGQGVPSDWIAHPIFSLYIDDGTPHAAPDSTSSIITARINWTKAWR